MATYPGNYLGGTPHPLYALHHPSGGQTALFLVRHGRTRGNRLQLLQGISDIPLDPLGGRQATQVARRLARDAPYDALLCSPLSRARATAAIIGDRIGLEPTIVPGLIEMNFGVYEGVPFEHMARERPDLASRLLDLDDYDVAWPEGESRRSFYARVRDTFQSILLDYSSHRVIVVGHGGVLGAFLAMTHGLSPNDLSVYDLLNCSLTHLQVSAEGATLHCRNEVDHLDPIGDEAEGDEASEVDRCD
jgi:broad specificity phosphatase PhoE